MYGVVELCNIQVMKSGPEYTIPDMRVAVIGTGYVGLVTGVCLADAGHAVVCVDNNAEKIGELQAGVTPIFEPGLEDVLKRTIKAGRISFTIDIEEGVRNAAVVFLALPTPPQQDGSADLSAILSVAKSLGKLDRPEFQVIVDKSTVPVGTSEKVTKVMTAEGGTNFAVVSNPEFLREGFAVDDFMKPERVVVGTNDERAAKIMASLYASFVDESRPLIMTDAATAELAKYAANTFLVVKISFMNEIAHICEETGADVDTLRNILGTDSRIGHRFLFPGIGYGGSCFPKDVRALYYTSEYYGYEFKMLNASLAVNAQQHAVPVERLKKHFGGSLRGKTIGIWGLAFKPNTDDIREAPALAIISMLLDEGANIQAYDPEALENVKRYYDRADEITLAYHKYAATENADALIVATEWQEFREADLERVRTTMKQPVVFDGRNIFKPKQMRSAGFTYYSIGRPNITQE